MVRLLRWSAALVITLALLAAVLATMLVWRLSQGPLELTWLVTRIERMVNAPDNPTRVSIGAAALTWDGFQHGFDRPVDIRLTDIAVTDPDGRKRMTVPRVDLSIYFRYLVFGRLVPRAIEIDGPRFTLIRGPDGTVTLDLGSLNETTDAMAPAAPAAPPPVAAPELVDILRELAQPMRDAGSADFYSHLNVLRVRGASLTLLDHRQQTTWNAPKAEIELRRLPGGGVDGEAMLSLALGAEEATLSLTGALLPGDGGARIALRLTPLHPSTLARVAPHLHILSALDAPLRITADIAVDSSLTPRTGSLRADIGAGAIRVGDTLVPLSNADAALTVAGETVTIDAIRLAVLGRPGGAPTELRATGVLRRSADGVTGHITAGFDQVLFADLPNLWPKAAAPDARDWIIENIPSGIARNASVKVEIAARADLTGLAVTHVTGGIDGDDLTVHWLRPVPPLERGKARLNFLDKDTLEILVSTARQRGGARGGTMTASNGKMVITGLSVKDQFTQIDADIASPVAAALGLLREPRLNLLDKQKFEFKDPAGEATVRASIWFPLEKTLKVEDLVVKVNARMTKLRLAALVAGRDLDQGEIDLEATNTGLTIKGQARLASIPVQLEGAMDFRDGPPTQVQNRVTVTGTASARQLAAAGLDGEDWLLGDVTGTAVWTDRRNGTADVTIDADLRQAILAVPPLNWSKPAGTPAKGSGRLVLGKDQLRLIDRVVVEGEGVSFRGTMDCANNRVSLIKIDRATFGRSEVKGTVGFPAGQPITVNLTGPVLDASVKLAARGPKPEKPAGDRPPEAAWTMDAQFDRVFLAHGKTATNLMARGSYNGHFFPALTVGGRLAADKGFRLDVTGGTGQRRVAVTADDAGALLLGLDLIKSIEGGTLNVVGTFDDRNPDRPLNGSARITDFRVRGSVGLAKLLQAMTLYGLVDVLRGPGIGFNELVAPFRMDERHIVLDNARAFSSSLGITAKGQLLPHEDRVDMEGTIVPAYFFNSLLGSIPLVGKLFSPETGGGLFAARYTVRGPLEDPTVFVNPLSALTPGFLREIFGIF